MGEDTLKNCYKLLFKFTKDFPDLTPWYELFAPKIGMVSNQSLLFGGIWQSNTLKGGIIDKIPVSVSVALGNNEVTNTLVLKQNYPNPFNASTQIEYIIYKNPGLVTSVKIFNLRGQEITTLIEALQFPGIHRLVWNGTDNKGKVVPSGVYLLTIKNEAFRQTRKLILIK